MTNIPDCYPYYNWKTIFMVTVILNQKLIAQYLHLHAVKNLENFNLCQNRRERERACQESGLYWPLYLELKLVSLGYALYGFEVCPFGLNFPMMWRTSCLLGQFFFFKPFCLFFFVSLFPISFCSTTITSPSIDVNVNRIFFSY